MLGGRYLALYDYIYQATKITLSSASMVLIDMRIPLILVACIWTTVKYLGQGDVISE